MAASGSPICGVQTTKGSSCKRRVQTGSTCFMHDDEGPPEDHGAPTGNENAVGNAGGEGAPDDNTRALKHGVYQPVERRLKCLTPEERTLFDYYYEEYQGKAVQDASTSLITRAASAATLSDRLVKDLFEDGMFEEGELRLERITALTTLMREKRLALKEIGYYDLPR